METETKIWEAKSKLRRIIAFLPAQTCFGFAHPDAEFFQRQRAPGRKLYLILCILFVINVVSCRPATALSIIVQAETATPA